MSKSQRVTLENGQQALIQNGVVYIEIDHPIYQYELVEPFTYFGQLCANGYNQYLKIDLKGTLSLDAGYRWDGATRAIDTDTIIRGSLIHDGYYQLGREHMIRFRDRVLADQELYKVCLEDGMAWLRAQYIYWAVRLLGADAWASKPAKAPTVKIYPDRRKTK